MTAATPTDEPARRPVVVAHIYIPKSKIESVNDCPVFEGDSLGHAWLLICKGSDAYLSFVRTHHRRPSYILQHRAFVVGSVFKSDGRLKALLSIDLSH